MSTSPRDEAAPAAGTKPLSTTARQRLQKVFEHAKKSLDKGDFDYAYDLFSQCVAEDPTNVVYAQHLRTNLERKHGTTPKTSRFGGLSLRLSGGRGGMSKAAGKGQWHEAFKAGCAALGHNPFDVGVLLEFGDACKELGGRECRLFYLRWALDIDVNHEQANRDAANAFEALGLFDQAITCLQRVQKLRPHDAELSRAVSHMSVEQTIKKGGYKQELLKPGVSAAAKPQAGAVENEGDEEPVTAKSHPVVAAAKVDNEQKLLDAIRLRPTETANYLELADLYSHGDRLKDAERVLTTALEATGGGDLDLRERLEETQMRRMRQQVDVALRKADVDKSPQAKQLAQKMQAQANQVELEVYAARAARYPQNSQYQFELGMRLKRAGKYREAVGHFQQARNDAKRLAETQLQLGECFQHIEQFRLAMTAYEAAIAAAEGHDDGQFRLSLYRAGVLATGLKDWDRAEKYLTRLADLDFGYRDVADRLDKLAQMRNT